MAKKASAEMDVEDFVRQAQSLRLRSEALKCDMRADDLAKDLTGAELLLDKHQQSKKEIAALEEAFRQAARNGQQLLLKSDSTVAVERLKDLMVDLSNERTSLSSVWNERQCLYEQCRDLQTFYIEIEEANSWIDRQQAALAEEEDGLDFDALIKKQEDLERAVAAQDEKIRALDELATKLIDGMQQHVDNKQAL